MAMPDRWLVVVAGKDKVDELQKFPDDQVSFLEAAGEVSTSYSLALSRI